MKCMLVLSILCLTIISCGKRCPCDAENISPAFVAYAPNEIDTIEIRRFAKGSNFSQPSGTLKLTAANSSQMLNGDTTMIFGTVADFRINDQYDWEIFNPSDNKLIRISDVFIQKQTMNCGGIFSLDPQPCISQVTSFKKNGITTSLDQSAYFRGLIIRK